MRPHFAHYQNDVCDVFSEGETAEHLQGKYQLKEWLEAQGFQVELEAYLPQLMQRPDLLVQMGNQPIALEFQCSPISIQKITERTMGYHQAGYQVIWILGNKFPFQKQLTAFQKACLTNLENQLVLFRYSVERERLEYHYNFYLKQNQKMSQSKKVLRHGQSIKLHLNQKSRPARAPLNMEIEHNKLLRHLQFPSVKSKRFLTRLLKN